MNHLMKRGTKCLLVHPFVSALSFWNYPEVCKLVDAKYPAAPLGLATVAGLLPQQWEFKLVDLNVEPLRDDHLDWADIVCTGGMLPQQRSILSIIDHAHARRRLVAVGGADITSQPSIYQSADFIVEGEGEVTIPMFLADLERGSKSGQYKSSELADMRNTVVPRFDLVDFKNYLHAGVQFSRGCPFNCEFCDIIELFGRYPRAKTADQVIAELQSLYDLGYRGHIDLVDDNLIGNKRALKTVLPAVKDWSEKHRYPFYYSTQASANLADDDELLQMMRDIDFRYVFVGFETPDDSILIQTQKKQNLSRDIPAVARKIYSYGIILTAGYVLGFDAENATTHQLIIQAIRDSGTPMVMFGMLYALPNTQLAARLKREGRLFGEHAILSGENPEIDQTTGNLNYIPRRPIVEVLKDYITVIGSIYDPAEYYRRVRFTALKLRIDYLYKPRLRRLLLNLKAFVRICRRAGFNRTTGVQFWKTLLIVLLRNPKALEASTNLSAMFIHFYQHTLYNIDLRRQKIASIESEGEQAYNARMFALFADARATQAPMSPRGTAVYEESPK